FGSDSASCANTPQPPASAGFTGNDAAWQGAFSASLGAYAGLAALIRFELGTDPGVHTIAWYVDDIQVTNISRPSACPPAHASVSEVSSAASGRPLLLRSSGGNLILRYQEIAGAGGYNLYEGILGSWYSHAASTSNVCGAAAALVSGMRESTLTPSAGGRY